MKKLFLALTVCSSFFITAHAQTPDMVRFEVPHSTQAPTGKWKDPRFGDGCEETTLIMAMAWMMGEHSIDRATAERQIIEMTALERKMFGFHHDTSIADTAKLMKAYFNVEPEIKQDINIEDIKQALYQKQLPIVAINGAPLKLYRRPPPRHMIVVTGFDPTTNMFFIHDPLIAKPNITIPSDRLQAALRDYPSGIHKAVRTHDTAMILVQWPWAS